MELYIERKGRIKGSERSREGGRERERERDGKETPTPLNQTQLSSQSAQDLV